MIGVEAPLFAVLLVQAAFSVFLLGPHILAKPVTLLLRLTHDNIVGFTVVMTIAALQVSMLAASIAQLYFKPAEESSVVQLENTARSQLHAVLCGSNLLLIFLTRKLSFEIEERDKMERNHRTLEKQVHGARDEYNRAVPGAAQHANADEIAAGNTELKEQVESMEQELDSKTAALQGLQQQAHGLQKEWDHLTNEQMAQQGGPDAAVHLTTAAKKTA